MEDRLKYKITQYKNAISNFEDSLNIEISELDDIIADTVKSGIVQKFEFCIELLWKTLKVYLLEINGIDCSSPKLIIKEYFRNQDFSSKDYEILIGMINDRNSLSHIYNKEQFEDIYSRIIISLPIFKKFFN